jgi:hypothetical protein
MGESSQVSAILPDCGNVNMTQAIVSACGKQSISSFGNEVKISACLPMTVW